MPQDTCQVLQYIRSHGSTGPERISFCLVPALFPLPEGDLPHSSLQCVHRTLDCLLQFWDAVLSFTAMCPNSVSHPEAYGSYSHGCLHHVCLSDETYLMAGYYFTATEHYDIKWTMPHCVLTLKLIGLAIDYYDGGKDPELLTPEQRRFAVRGVPTLLEVSGFSYFYGAFMVGPQFSMTDYQKLAKGEMTDVPGQRPNSFVPALKRLSLGLLFLVTYTLSSPYISEEYLISDDYMEKPFWFRCGYILVWGKIILYKYVTCWLVTEGVCILVGLGYNGNDQNGKPVWDACANMKVWLYETTPLFTGTIASFNINTNAWVARYVFKRLKFLGNKLLSQALALFFLAIWHGLHSGYLVCFQMELLIVIVERQVINLVRDSPTLSTLASITALQPIFYVLQQTNHWMFMGYSLVPFCLFTWDKWMKVYKSIYFLGHVLFFTLLLVLPYIRKLLVPRKEKLKKAE
uniref:Lysophospholipid acyltransferase 5 n=1 Tax=Gallus gallus TaxID=9031 RepID=A0A8V0ZVH7_CHICK